MRYPNEPVELRRNIEVIYTSRKAKEAYLKEKYDIKVNVWIDDNPKWLFVGG
jgi:hypothetical protein